MSSTTMSTMSSTTSTLSTFSVDTQSTTTQRNLKNIVVIGASVAGHSFVNALAGNLPSNYRIILIERNEFVQHAPIVVRAIVAPGWEAKNFTAPIKQETIFPINSRHRVLCPNRVVKLRKNTIWLEKEFEGSDELAFERCIIATGAQSPLPIRPAPASTLDEWREALRQTQADIKAAQSILIVGGGSVGIEVAGEISDIYPNKKLTLVHWDVGLLHPSDSGGTTAHTYVPPRTSPRLVSALEKQLRQRGVELILKDRVDFEAAKQPGQWGGKSGNLGGMWQIPLVSGKMAQADYIFNSTGNRPNSSLVRAVDEGALTTNGYISVNQYFRVRASYPESPLSGQYYALGDCANMPSWKTGIAASAEGEALAAIIASSLNGNYAQPYTPPSRLKESTVLLGSKGGAAIIRLPIIGNIRAPDFVVDRKSQDFLTGKLFHARFSKLRHIQTSLSYGS